MTSYQIHRLTENERKYVETGEISNSYRPSQMETRVQEKINLLPARIRSLFDDIELLSEEGYLDVNGWAHGWLDLLNIQQPMHQDKLKRSFTRFSDEEGYQVATAPDEFGYSLGIMLDELESLSSETADELPEKDTGVVTGFR